MARYDKYDPVDGGFRAPLAADMAKNSGGNPVACGLNAAGRVVPGAGNTGVLGVVSVTRDMKSNDIVDTMTDGEVVEFVGVSGTAYWARDTTGAIEAGVAGGGPPVTAGVVYARIGHTVEATRLVVRSRR